MARNEELSPVTTTFYDDLEKLLEQQISKQPNLMNLRLRLAELYYETRRTEDFLRQARQMRALIKGSVNVEEWRKVVSMGRMIADHDPMFSEAAIGATIEFIAPRAVAAKASYTRIGDDERFRKPLQELSEGYTEIRKDPRFINELDFELIQTAGHPSSLQHARRLSQHLGGAQIYLKREDLPTQPSHMTAAVVGQALLARRMGKKTLVASSPNGRSGALIASVAARLGLKALIYMDAEQMQLQSSNVFRMMMMGTHVTAPDNSRHKSPDIRRAAWDHWGDHPGECFLVMGLDAAPHPYPMMTLEFASATGRECQRQLYSINKKIPDLLVARAGDNADAIGFFPPFLKALKTRLVCVDAPDHLDNVAGGLSSKDDSTSHANPLTLQEQQLANVIMEGMDYPRVKREHNWLKASGRVEYVKTTATAARQAINNLSLYEGIIPAIQTSYALAWAFQEAAKLTPEQSVVIMMTEKVDKNIWQVGKALGVPL